ncbi:MAG: UbiA prenyltransferase family protein [Candidatus Thorarchaeota archaeon]
MALKAYLRLMRPHQWYKNLLVFIAVVFAGSKPAVGEPWNAAVFNFANYPLLIIGFLSLCAVSSAGYILNDLFDIEKDAAHPEKKERPLPSGKASKSTALVLAIALYAIGLSVALIDGLFFFMVLLYIINSQLYSWKLRKWAVVDVCVIAVGFVIRAVAGTFLIKVDFTSWLIIGVFFFALVLGFGKRKNELQLLGEEAAEHKPVFKQYTDAMLDQGIGMSATWVVLFYALYCFNTYGDSLNEQPILLTVPIAAGLILRYIYLIQIGSPVGRKPHLAIKDKGILLGVLLFGLTLFVTLFYWEAILAFLESMFPTLQSLFPSLFP